MGLQTSLKNNPRKPFLPKNEQNTPPPLTPDQIAALVLEEPIPESKSESSIPETPSPTPKESKA